MASEELLEPVEEKKAFHEGIDLKAVNDFVSTENAKEKMEIKSSVVDGIIGNEDVNLIKEETEVPSKLSISTEPNLIITEKLEISEKCTENLEAELIEHEENSSTYEKASTQEDQEKINGETENGLHSTQFTEECSPELVKGNEIPANGTSFLSKEIQEKSDSDPSKIEKIDSEEVTKEDAPQNQISEKEETENDLIKSNSTSLSDKNCQKEVEIPVGDERQIPEEDLTREVEIPSSITPVVTEEVSEEAKGNNEILEEVQHEKMHQTEAAKDNLMEEKECQAATEDESRGVSEILTAEETITKMISEEVKPTEDTIGLDEKDETTESDKAENSVDKSLTSTLNEETGTTNESLEKISDESTLETVVSRDVTPEFEIKGSQKALSAKTDNMDTEKIEDEDEAKNFEEVEPSESTTAPIKVEEATPNDCEEEKPEGDDKLKNIETNDEQEVHSFLVTEKKLQESKPSTSEEILSSDRDTIETKSVEEPEEDEKDVAQNELTEPSNNTEASTDAEIPRENIELESENAFSSELIKSEEVLPETPSESTVLSEMEIGNTEHKVIDSEKDNTEAENSHEPEEISDKADVETSTSEDQIKEDEIVNTNVPDNMEQNFEVDDKQEESLPGDIVNETTPSIQKEEVLSEKDENIKNEITEESQSSTDDDKIVSESLQPENESDVHEKSITSPMNQEDSTANSVVEGNSDDILLHDNEQIPQLEITSEIQSSVENELAKEQCVQDKSEEHITEVDGSTEVTEVQEEVQNSTRERSYEQDQLIPEKATEQDDLQNASFDSEIETEKPQMGDTSNQEAVGDSLIPQTDDKSELEVKPEERTEEKSLANKEITQTLEVVEEPCIITDSKEELPEEDSTIVQEESSSEPSITTIQQDQQSEESDTKQTEANQATDDISEVKGSDVSTPLISKIEETDERSINKEEDTEENVAVEAPNEEAQVAEKLEESIAEITESTNPSEDTEVERSQSATVAPETENLEVTPNGKLEDESDPTAIDAKSAESENITEESTEQEEISIENSNTREFQINQTEIAAEEDQQSQDSDVKASVPDQATAEVLEVDNSEVDAEPGASVEQIKEESVDKEESVVLQKEDVVVKMPEEEAEIEAENEKHIIEEEIPEVTNPSEVSEVEFTQSETVPFEIENSEVIPNEKVEDESKPTAIDAKSTEFENTTDEPCEEREVLIEPSNTRGLQIDQAEIIAEQDQPSNESDVKPTEPDQATDEEIEKESVAKEGSVVLQEEDAAVEMPKEEVEKIETENEKHIEEQVPEIANPSEVTEVELNQSETIPPETEILEAVSNKEHGDEIKLDGSDINSSEFESTTDASTEEKEVSTEPSNTRELQIDQTMEIIAEQDQLSKESEVKPTELDRATDVVSTVTVENSDVDATVSATAEEIGHESAAKEGIVVLQEEVVPVDEMPKEEAADEVHTEEEIPQIVTPSEINEDQLVETDTETVGPEASEEKFEDGSKCTETELKADQMDKSPDELIEENTDASVSLSGEEINGKLGESEVLPESTGEQEVEGEKIDSHMPKEGTSRGIEVADELCDKHIEGEILRTGDPEVNNATEEQLKVELTEREVDPQIFETQKESPDEEKATEKSALVEEKSDAIPTLVPGETQTKETESSVLPQSITEVIVPEEKVFQHVDTNEEEISQTVPPTEITDIQSVESEILLPEIKQSEIVSNEKLGDESEVTENAINLAQIESSSDELIEEKLNASLSASVEQVTERFENSEVILENVGEQVQGERTNAEMPKEETGQEIEEADEPCDKHIKGEIHRTLDPEIAYAAEGSNAILTEEEVDSQKFATKTELPEQEEKTEESTSVEDKSYATASLLPGEGQIEVETSDVPQSTTESLTVLEEEISHEVVTSEEPLHQVQDIAGEITKFADPEISEVAVQSNIMLNEEEVDSEKLVNEIQLPDLGSTTENSALVEENSGDGANAIPGEGQFKEKEIVNEVTSVAPLSDIESVTVPEEKVPQEIETYDEPSDKHIVGEHLENDTSTDIQEDKGEQGQTMSSPVEQPDSENTGTEMESALLEKTNDVKENLDEAGLTSFVEEGAIMSQTDNGSETVPVGVQMHAEDQEAKGHTERDINAIEFLKTAEHKVAVDETNEHTEDTVRNSIEQNKVVEEETNQSEEPEQDFSFIVSSFLINKVLSEDNQKVDDSTEQNNASTIIPKTLHDENVQEVTATNEPETRDEEEPYATSSREDLKPEQQQEEENEVKEDGVEQDYLPFSRFLMDKILRQEETKNPGKEAKAIEETDKHVISDDGIQVQEKIEENSNLVAEPQQKGEMPFSFDELTTDFEKGETPIKEVANTSVGTDVISTQEKIEENTAVEEFPKQEGEGSHSPIELARDVEKEEKPAEKAPEAIEDENKTLVSDVGFSSLETNEEENSSFVVVAEQESENNISHVEAIRDVEKEDKSIEQKNDGLAINEGIPVIEKMEENTGEVAIPEQGENTSYPVEVVRDCEDEKSAEKDETIVSKVTSLEEDTEDLAYREPSKDLVEETSVNAHEISNPEKVTEENKTVVVPKEEEHKNEVIVDEETPKYVRNIEDNYVFVEHEVNQFEEPKEILEEKVADEVCDAAISNLEKKQTDSLPEIHNEERSLVGQGEVTEKGMDNSAVNFLEIEQSLSDVPKVPVVSEIVKEPVGNETDMIHGEEQVKEVAGTVVDSLENKSQDKPSEVEATKMEKKSEEVMDEEHEEEEEEEESHEERETEISSRDLTVKSESKETEMKSAQKKSHNILSGVGSKVKHSFTKVKKVFTGKSKSGSPTAK